MPTLTKFLGRNGQLAPTELKDEECTKCQNLFLSGHSMVMRGGNALAFTDAVDTTDQVLGLHRTYNLGAAFWVWSVGSTVRSLKTGSQVTIKTFANANRLVEFVEASQVSGPTNYLYIIPGNLAGEGSKTQQSDGTAAGTIDHPSASAPASSVGIWINNRLFVNDVGNVGRMWFTDTNDPTTFRSQSSSVTATDGGYMDVSPGDGDTIKGFARIGSTLIIFKERSIHSLSGTSFTGSQAFVLSELHRGVGCKSPRTIQTTELGVLFLDSDGRVRYFYAPARQLFSEIGRPMEDLTLAIPTTALANAAAVYFNRRYLLSFQSASGTRNDTTFALDLRLAHPLLGFWVDVEVPSCWTEITGNAWGVATTTAGPGDSSFPYYGDATANGRVWQFLTGNTDNGAAIPYAWKSKAYGADQPKIIKSVSEVISSTRTMTAAVTHEVYTDLASTATATKAITPQNATYSVNTWRASEKIRGSVLNAGLSGSSSIGGEILAASWDWSPRRIAPVQG